MGSSSGGPAISISLPGVDNHDTERRRQIALKALKDRLSKTEQSTDDATKWPSLDDHEPGTAPTHQGTPAKESAKSEDEEGVVIHVEADVDDDDKKPLLQ